MNIFFFYEVKFHIFSFNHIPKPHLYYVLHCAVLHQQYKFLVILVKFNIYIL